MRDGSGHYQAGYDFGQLHVRHGNFLDQISLHGHLGLVKYAAELTSFTWVSRIRRQSGADEPTEQEKNRTDDHDAMTLFFGSKLLDTNENSSFPE